MAMWGYANSSPTSLWCDGPCKGRGVVECKNSAKHSKYTEDHVCNVCDYPQDESGMMVCPNCGGGDGDDAKGKFIDGPRPETSVKWFGERAVLG